jgi:ABC-2 type transport system ATP-binding protein
MSTITFSHVGKSYGSTVALDDVSFEIQTGELVALLGPNGAGKTTAIEILLGLRTPSDGYASIGGELPRSLPARRRIGATPQTTGFPDALRVRELVAFAAAHYPAPVDIDALLAAFDLTDLSATRAGDLSGGQQRRVALALAFAGDPEIVVLDEPTTGLDVESRRRLWEQLRANTGARRTTLFTTHYLEEAEALATRIIVLVEGRIRFDGAPSEFRAAFGHRRVAYVDARGERVVCDCDDPDAYVRELVRNEVPFRDLLVTQPSFEDVFLHLTGAAS